MKFGLNGLLVLASGSTLLLVAASLSLTLGNRAIQADVNQRQQFINQTIQLGRVNEALARALAQVAMRDNDEKLKDLLTQHGITINVTPNSTTPAPAPTPAPGGTK